MVVIILFHFHIPLVMDHIFILGIGLEIMSLFQASCSAIPWIQMWPIYLYLCNEGFLKILRGNKEKCLLFSLPSTLTASVD